MTEGLQKKVDYTLVSSATAIVIWLPSELDLIRMGDWRAQGIGNGIQRLSPLGHPLVEIQPSSVMTESLQSESCSVVVPFLEGMNLKSRTGTLGRQLSQQRSRTE